MCNKRSPSSSNHLVGPADEVQVVAVQELADDIGPEGEGDAAVVFSPTLHIFVWVGPQQVTQQAWHTHRLEVKNTVSWTGRKVQLNSPP